MNRDAALNAIDTLATCIGARPEESSSFLRTLDSLPELSQQAAIRFLNLWHPVSRLQPQLLLRLASALTDQSDRASVIKNLLDEEGFHPGHDPHWVLLEDLIVSAGGRIAPDREVEVILEGVLADVGRLSAAEACGALAAIEGPALDISDSLRKLVTRIGHPGLVEQDPYLVIHVEVEPVHIVDTHRMALRHATQGEAFAVLSGYLRIANFWRYFWPRALRTLH